MSKDVQPTRIMADFILEGDHKARRYLLTAKSGRGRDFLVDYATSASEWWGKSLIVKQREVDDLLDLTSSKGLEVYIDRREKE